MAKRSTTKSFNFAFGIRQSNDIAKLKMLGHVTTLSNFVETTNLTHSSENNGLVELSIFLFKIVPILP